jgi:hypothetical protein
MNITFRQLLYICTKIKITLVNRGVRRGEAKQALSSPFLNKTNFLKKANCDEIYFQIDKKIE